MLLKMKLEVNFMDFQALYFRLFNQITDALTQLDAQNYGAAAAILRRAQQSSEETYLAGEAASEP